MGVATLLLLLGSVAFGSSRRRLPTKVGRRGIDTSSESSFEGPPSGWVMQKGTGKVRPGQCPLTAGAKSETIDLIAALMEFANHQALLYKEAWCRPKLSDAQHEKAVVEFRNFVQGTSEPLYIFFKDFDSVLGYVKR